MILSNGCLLPSEQSGEVLSALRRDIPQLLAQPPLDPFPVVEACHQLAIQIREGAFHEQLQSLLRSGLVTQKQIAQACQMLERESLLYQLEIQLGWKQGQSGQKQKLSPLRPPGQDKEMQRWRLPLGVLLHIAAGNAEALPAFSVVEGLLTGNINLLKLPSADDGLSIQILQALIALEPTLAPYIHVLDTPSSDLSALQSMAELANGIIVWGGDEAVSAVRRFAPANSRLIEWGHKLSFAYLTEKGLCQAGKRGLEELAQHMIETNQLFCSSCQGIFLDTWKRERAEAFCREFLPILEEWGKRRRLEAGLQAQITLEKYARSLEPLPEGELLLEGEYTSLRLCREEDQELELSMLFGNSWVKMLPRDRIFSRLFLHKGHLQTVGLLCGKEEWAELAEQFCRVGAVRVTLPGEMSQMLSGEAHDGEYPLQRYTRIVEIG